MEAQGCDLFFRVEGFTFVFGFDGDFPDPIDHAIEFGLFVGVGLFHGVHV